MSKVLDLSAKQKLVYSFLGDSFVSISEISRLSGIPTNQLQPRLYELMMMGLVIRNNKRPYMYKRSGDGDE